MHKNLEGDTTRTADPNRLKGNSILCDVMNGNKNWEGVVDSQGVICLGTDWALVSWQGVIVVGFLHHVLLLVLFWFGLG